MGGQHRRQPAHVLRLLNDAQARVQEREVNAKFLPWLRKYVARLAAEWAARGDNGTRRHRR